MAAPETVEAVAEVLDTIEETLDTIERIPKVNLNGTTKGQQILILTVTATAGAAVGVAVSRVYFKRKFRLHYEELIEKELQEAKVYYSKLHKTGDFADPISASKALHGDDEVATPEDLGEVVDKLEEFGYIPPTTDQRVGQSEEELIEVKTSIATSKGEEPEVEVEVTQTGRERAITRNIFADSEKEPEWDYEIEERLRDPLKPYVIHHDEYMENPDDHEQITVTFYQEDDVLTDDHDEVIPDADDTVGLDNLVRFGHGSQDPNVVYIRDDRRNRDFEVARHEGSYVSAVLGLEHSDQRGSRRRENYGSRQQTRRFRVGEDD